MCALMAPVNPMAAEGKETVLDVLRRDRKLVGKIGEKSITAVVETYSHVTIVAGVLVDSSGNDCLSGPRQ